MYKGRHRIPRPSRALAYVLMAGAIIALATCVLYGYRVKL